MVGLYFFPVGVVVLLVLQQDQIVQASLSCFQQWWCRSLAAPSQAPAHTFDVGRRYRCSTLLRRSFVWTKLACILLSALSQSTPEITLESPRLLSKR